MAYMTPQEFQMQQEMLRQGRVPQQTPISTPGMSAGMAPGTSAAMPDFAAAAQTFDGENERIAQQRLMAQQMTEQSFKSPELIRAGNVSVAGANPMTALAQALRAGTGAYGNMQAGKASEALAEKEAKRDTALGEVATYTAEQELLAATRAQENADRTATAADTRNTETASNNAINQALAQDKQNEVEAENLRGGTTEYFVSPDGVVATFVDRAGNRFMGGRGGPPMDYNAVQGWTPIKASAMSESQVSGQIPEAEMTIDQRRKATIAALPSSGERLSANTMLTTSEALAGLIPQGNAMVEGGQDYHVAKEYGEGVARTVTPPYLEDAAGNTVATMLYTDEQKEFVGNMANAVGDFRKARTGANVTMIETELGKNWDPSVKGINIQERVRRGVELQKFINRNLGQLGIEGYSVADPFTPGITPPSNSPGKDDLSTLTLAELRAMANE